MRHSLQFRPVRELYADAMLEAWQFDSTTQDEWAALEAYVKMRHNDPHFRVVKLVAVEKYGEGLDPRNGWDTHLVVAEWSDGSIAPVGYTNRAVQESQA